jgi:hypothetical protein
LERSGCPIKTKRQGKAKERAAGAEGRGGGEFGVEGNKGLKGLRGDKGVEGFSRNGTCGIEGGIGDGTEERSKDWAEELVKKELH